MRCPLHLFIPALSQSTCLSNCSITPILALATYCLLPVCWVAFVLELTAAFNNNRGLFVRTFLLAIATSTAANCTIIEQKNGTNACKGTTNLMVFSEGALCYSSGGQRKYVHVCTVAHHATSSSLLAYASLQFAERRLWNPNKQKHKLDPSYPQQKLVEMMFVCCFVKTEISSCLMLNRHIMANIHVVWMEVMSFI